MPVSIATSTGSSPLARGLHHDEDPVAGPSGIIPARAGFTRTQSPAAARSGGSSPLARGLRNTTMTVLTARRIIPARAGFTSSPSTPAASTRDHPRSRGVYTGSATDHPGHDGSSPLARGLLNVNSEKRERMGIIPARAGFTTPKERIAYGQQDHPRSRGVYQQTHASHEVRTGSSPLARGLPADPRVARGEDGIIPARAGFTPDFIPGPPMVGDHPRSRGVYRRERL